MPDLRPTTPEEARAYCERLARSHYENFTVVSAFFPREKRQDMFNVYAFCRYSDDLGDEEMGQGDRVAALDRWDDEIDRMVAGDPRHPILVALRETAERYAIPPKPLHDLVEAFRMDQTRKRWETFDDLRRYCRHSADPVGRLVLYVFEEAREETFRLSDETCTGLQLANFWQDVRRDLADNDRIYLPQEDLRRFEVTEEQLREGRCDERFRALMRFEVDRARGYFERGLALLPLVRRDLRVDLELFGRGGVAILDAIERQGYDVLARRPRLSKGKKAWLVLRAWVRSQRERIAQPSSRMAMSPETQQLSRSRVVVSGDEARRDEGGDPRSERRSRKRSEGRGAAGASRTGSESAAFAHCAKVVRRSAGNFYYAFAILPRDRRRAMYALYAFCRAADDAVDEGGTRAEKAAALAALRSRLSATLAGHAEGPMFTALAATMRRHALDPRHLADVLDGCAMDLDGARYETFDDLGRYLDRVASAVGRATMQICGVDPAAHAEYAIAGGYAVQLTNILRDVKEDLERGRVYLPQEDLRRFGVPEADLAAATATPRLRELVRFEVARTRAYYARAREAIGDRERRLVLPLEAIVRIYSRLLDAIEARGYDVLSERVSVPGWRKAFLGLDTWARARLGLPLGR